ncbi:recombinase family protein [Furfurilactobacillus curtus]|uniref:DNA invertase n=1 Tax=Furfurilactobacillus curtus TaxID=1746200 RepID=A0ABQ5JQ06_9LACO
MAKIIAYVRTSTNHQDLGIEFQRQAVSKFHPEQIFSEQVSGRKSSRPELTKALACLEEGDTLLVYKLDRLGRSVRQLVNIVAELDERGARFRSIHDNLDTGTTNGRFMFNMLSAVAELEADMISERTRDALKVTDKPLGRRRKLSPEQEDKVCNLHAKRRVSVRELSEQFGVSESYVYKLSKSRELR